tara:strand:- start:133 stop:276 length:144 start_codon:yes stop_codon:yes gene_type:complete
MKEAYEIQYISKVTIESESHTKALNTAIKNKLVEIENVMCVRKKKIK